MGFSVLLRRKVEPSKIVCTLRNIFRKIRFLQSMIGFYPDQGNNIFSINLASDLSGFKSDIIIRSSPHRLDNLSMC